LTRKGEAGFGWLVVLRCWGVDVGISKDGQGTSARMDKGERTGKGHRARIRRRKEKSRGKTSGRIKKYIPC
jgi:hypothetical protein